MGVGREIGGDDVGDDGEIDEEAAFLAILRQHRDARRHGIRGAARTQFAAVDQNGARLRSAARRRSLRRPRCGRRRAGPRGTRSRRSAARTMPRRRGPRRSRGPRARSAHPAAARRGSGSKESSRPTISEMSSLGASPSAVSRTPVTRPSFITVTRSEISKISAMRCET